MSATSFLRHRRAVAVKYITELLATSARPAVARVLAEHNIDPDNAADLAGNTDVLSIADKLASLQLQQPELDDLETLDTLTTGDRAAVHGAGVEARQFRPLLQHPAQETVGVGNMHDAVSTAAEDLANVSNAEVIEHDGSMAAAAESKADDALSSHSGLPAGAPTSAPVSEQSGPIPGGNDDAGNRQGEQSEGAGESADHPTDPDGANPGPETAVDLQRAAEDLRTAEGDREKLEEASVEALEAMDRDQLLDYAAKREITLDGIRPGTQAATIRRQILAKRKEA